MKKILIIIFCIIIITGCKQNNEDISKEKFIINHTLNDGRIIHFTFDIPYKDSYLSETLSNNKITIEEFLNNLKHISTLNDGGSKIYEYNEEKKIYGNEKFYVITCNSLDNIKDIFIAKYKNSIKYNCSKKIDDLDGVSMTIKKDTLTNISATVIIKDTSIKENIYGDSFQIEKMEDNIWTKLEAKNDMIFNSIGYTVDKDNTLEFDINWEYYYGKLNKGKYRILKDTGESGEGIRHYITAEFVIE